MTTPDAHRPAVETVDAVIRRRRMTRSFDPDRPVGRDELETMLNLALRAPSAGHTQGWEFFVLHDITSVSRYWSATADGAENGWLRRMRTAPVLIVCCSDRQAYLDRYAEDDKGWADRDESRWPIPYWHVDVGMAAMLLLLAAEARGLGACWFGVPGRRWHAAREALAIPGHLDPVGVVAIGHPAPGPRSPSLRRGRRPFDDVVHWVRTAD